RQQHFVHLSVAEFDRFGGHAEELVVRGGAEITALDDALHHLADSLAALVQRPDRLAQLRAQLRTHPHDLLDAVLDAAEPRTDLVAQYDQRRTLRIVHPALRQHGRGAGAQAPDSL